MLDLYTPHHDGSERHVSALEPSLRDTVTVWLRVPHADPATGVWVRTTPDGEAHHVAAVVDRTTAHETWWRADIKVGNPVTNYRFLLDGGPTGYRNVNGTGVHARPIGDGADFRLSAHPPPPQWVSDTDFYQVFPDRFARSGNDQHVPSWAFTTPWDAPVVTDGVSHADGRAATRQLYGGDLGGVAAHLDHIESLHKGGIYLTPFFPAPSSHRYNASSFDRVDPLLGGDEALAELVAACHRRGIRVIGDLTINHSGSGHEWFRTAQRDENAPETGFYFFREHPHEYEAWSNVPSLPKLDLRNPELRRRLIDGPQSIVARWLRPPFDLDGWRVDAANMAGRLGDIDVNRDAAVTMRATLTEIKPDAYVVGEHAYDASRNLDGDGWHGIMNYLGFYGPAVGWLRADGIGSDEIEPLPLPRLSGRSVAESMSEVLAIQPWRSSVSGFNLLGSHDTARIRTVCGTAARQIAGAGLLYTFPGVPMVFAGDEIGLTGIDADTARQPMPWDPSRWDHQLLGAYRDLAELRRTSRALRHGGLRWAHVDDDVLVYLREATDQRFLVQISRADHPPVSIDASSLDGSVGQRRFGDEDVVAGDGVIVLPGDGPAVRVWELES